MQAKVWSGNKKGIKVDTVVDDSGIPQNKRSDEDLAHQQALS